MKPLWPNDALIIVCEQTGKEIVLATEPATTCQCRICGAQLTVSQAVNHRQGTRIAKPSRQTDRVFLYSVRGSTPVSKRIT